jgi:hypothetical protein
LQSKVQLIKILEKINKLPKAAGFFPRLESLGHQILCNLANYPGLCPISPDSPAAPERRLRLAAFSPFLQPRGLTEIPESGIIKGV